MKRILMIPPLLFLLMMGCTVKEPGTPSWQVEMTIPFADQTYSLQDLVADTTDTTELDSSGNWISQNGDTLIFNFADSIERADMEDRIIFDGFTNTVESFVGVRTVNAPGSQSVFYLFDEFGLQAGTFPIAPLNFNLTQELASFPEYDWFYVSSGYTIVTITNNLPISLENFSIDIYGDSLDNLIVHTYIQGPMDPDSVIVQEWPIPTNELIDNEMYVNVSGYSPGSATPIQVDLTDNVTVDMDMSSMEVTAAHAHIPTQAFYEDTSFALSETDTIIHTIIKEAYLTYSIYNGTELINTIELTLFDFVNNGQPFTDVFTLNPGETHTVTDLNLAGYYFDRPEMDNQFRALVNVDILDTSDPAYFGPPIYAQDEYAIVDEFHLVETIIQVSDLTLSHFEGIMDTLNIPIEQQSMALEGIPEGLQTLQLEYTNVDLVLENRIGLPATADLIIYAYKDGALAATLDVPPLSLPPGDVNNPEILETTIYGAEDLINVLPDSIRIDGDAFVAGLTTLDETQWIEGKYTIYTPFALLIGETTLEPEITKIDEGFDNRLHQVDITLDIINHMPLSGEATILASYDSSSLVNPGQVGTDTVVIFLQADLPAPIIGADGYVIEPGVGSVENTLDYDKLEMFANASADNPLYIKTLIVIHSTQGDTVRCKPTDYLTVGAYAHVIVDVDFEEEEGGGGQ